MPGNPAGGVSLGARSADPVSSGCPSWECELHSTLVSPEVIQIAVFVGLVVLLATVRFVAARDACREERRRVRREIDAFDAFIDFLGSLEPPARSVPSDATGAVALSTGGLSRDDRLDRILETYRETVMAVSHYDEDYGDTVLESVAAELGTETAIAVRNHDELSPELRNALVTQAHRAREARASYLTLVDDEFEALSSFATTGRTLETRRRGLSKHVEETAPHNRFDAAADVWQLLDGLESQCESTLVERQQRIHSQRVRENDHPRFLQEYLYQPLSGTNYPVLSRFVSLVGEIRSDRRRMVRAIVRSR